MVSQLVAGSGGQASGGDGSSGGSSTAATATEAVPGPVTRLLVIANRGISNLIQDLILVSERVFIAILRYSLRFREIFL